MRFGLEIGASTCGKSIVYEYLSRNSDSTQLDDSGGQTRKEADKTLVEDSSMYSSYIHVDVCICACTHCIRQCSTCTNNHVHSEQSKKEHTAQRNHTRATRLRKREYTWEMFCSV